MQNVFEKTINKVMMKNNLISNSKQRLRGEKHYVFMAKVNKIVLSDSNQKKNTIN